MKTITVFTPTYNRAYILKNLYVSLCQQTMKDFEWLIIDDGSTDDTNQLVSGFIKEGLLHIRYYYQLNGGKQRAINKGVKLATGSLFFIVDSDDYLSHDALHLIQYHWEKINGDSSYAGLCFRKMDIKTGFVLGGSFPETELDATSLELAYNYSYNIDKAEVFSTVVLRQFPFPEIAGETFVPEALVWYRIANRGLKLRCVDYGIYYCEYLPDGYTRNFHQNLKRNNRGFFLFYKELLFYKQPPLFPDKCKALIRLFQCWYYLVIKKIHL